MNVETFSCSILVILKYTDKVKYIEILASFYYPLGLTQTVVISLKVFFSKVV